MAHAAESTHWYDRKGNPAYEVESKKGGMRATTLRDARILDLVPSVTGIINLADKPGLNNWKIDQGILAALTLPRREDEPESDWLKRVKQDAREQAFKAAERGTAIHAAIQGTYEGKYPASDYSPHVKGARLAVDDKFPMREWFAERSFCHHLGFGGKTDLVAGSVEGESEPDYIVLDFKSKEFSPEDKLATWDEHHMQLAAYIQGMYFPFEKTRAAICYVSVTHPGLSVIVEVSRDDLERGWESFCALLAFWKSKNRYTP